jgi:hypothetical protein
MDGAVVPGRCGGAWCSGFGVVVSLLGKKYFFMYYYSQWWVIPLTRIVNSKRIIYKLKGSGGFASAGKDVREWYGW